MVDIGVVAQTVSQNTKLFSGVVFAGVYIASLFIVIFGIQIVFWLSNLKVIKAVRKLTLTKGAINATE